MVSIARPPKLVNNHHSAMQKNPRAHVHTRTYIHARARSNRYIYTNVVSIIYILSLGYLLLHDLYLLLALTFVIDIFIPLRYINISIAEKVKNSAMQKSRGRFFLPCGKGFMPDVLQDKVGNISYFYDAELNMHTITVHSQGANGTLFAAHGRTKIRAELNLIFSFIPVIIRVILASNRLVFLFGVIVVSLLATIFRDWIF